MHILLHHIHDDGWQRNFAADFPDHAWTFAFSPSEVAPALATAEVLLITNRACTPELGQLLAVAPRLKWIHFLTAGIDRGIAMGFPPPVRVSYSSGVKAPMVSEHAIALLLALVRQLPAIAQLQSEKRWEREEISARMRTLEDATVCIVGLGQIGREIARKLKVFGARVIGVSRNPSADENIVEVFARARLPVALAQADAVVLCTQADDASRHMLGEAALAHIKRGALLVNIARGSLVDQRALIAALERGTLGGAALDVQEREPLPPDDPLWSAPNLIVSPHSAGAGSEGYSGYRNVFADNLRRFIAGEPLRNEFAVKTSA